MGTPQVTVTITFATATDVSAFVRRFTIRRGRQMELDRFEAGAAMVVLDNRDRRFDPTHAASPYAPNVTPMRPIAITATWGASTYPLFTGYVEAWPQEWPAVGDAVVPARCTDAFRTLALARVAVSAPQERTDLRVARILDALPVALPRQLQAGRSDIQAEAVNEVALRHLQAVAQVEGGQLFMDRDGRVTFHHRHERIYAATRAAPVFGDGVGELPYVALEISSDDEQLWNHVIVARRGGITAERSDAASQAAYLRRTLERRDLAITSDAEAEAAAEWLLRHYAQPQLVIRSMVIDPQADDALWPQVLGRELGDRVIVRRRPPGGGAVMEQSSILEGVAWDVAPGRWRVTWRLSPAEREAYWILDDTAASVLDSTTRLAY